MTSSQTVQDSVNKYRHGVLVGNYGEEEFGMDLVNKGKDEQPTNISTMKASHKLENSLHAFHPVLAQQDKRTQTFYGLTGTMNSKTLKEPEKQTTYNIFHRQEFPRRVPVVENNCAKEQRLQKDKQLFDFTKNQLENTSFKKTSGKFHYRSSNNDPVLNQRGGTMGRSGRLGADDVSGEHVLAESGTALADALSNDNARGVEEDPAGAGRNKIGAIRPKSLDPRNLSFLMAKADAANLPKKQSKQPEDHINVGDEDEGQKSHILFGHGLTTDKFHSREFVTTYDLSFNQKIKPKTQINSFFQPDMTQTAKQFHRETFYQKNHQVNIPEFNCKTLLYTDKLCRPYAPFTKVFDQKHMKTEYLRK